MRPKSEMCPQLVKDELARYCQKGIMPGGFLTAVLQNKLFEAVQLADEDMLDCLPHVVAYIHNKLPGHCHGSAQKMNDYLDALPAPRSV